MPLLMICLYQVPSLSAVDTEFHQQLRSMGLAVGGRPPAAQLAAVQPVTWQWIQQCIAQQRVLTIEEVE